MFMVNVGKYTIHGCYMMLWDSYLRAVKGFFQLKAEDLSLAFLTGRAVTYTGTHAASICTRPFAERLMLHLRTGDRSLTQTRRRFKGVSGNRSSTEIFTYTRKKGNFFSLTDFIKITKKTKAGGPFDFYKSNFFPRCC